jgi:hypothetical protein
VSYHSDRAVIFRLRQDIVAQATLSVDREPCSFQAALHVVYVHAAPYAGRWRLAAPPLKRCVKARRDHSLDLDVVI